MKRHVGKINNTDKRCIVIYMQIPEDDDHALVVDTDALPDRWHDTLMNIIDHEGQNFTNIADLLGRRIMPDTNLDILNTLHNAQHLQRVLTSQVTMYPQPNRPIPLVDVIKAVSGDLKTENVNVNTLEDTNIDVVEDVDSRVSLSEENRVNSVKEQQVDTAKNLLVQAEMLIKEAELKKSQAYNLAPSLKPKVRTKKQTKARMDKRLATRKSKTKITV